MDNTTGGDADQGMEPRTLGGTQRLAIVVAVLGAVFAVFIGFLYDVAHRLALVAGVAQDAPHLYFGFVVGMAGFGGACLIPIFPRVAAVLLACAGIAFFVDVGWWALLASPFLVAAAVLALSKHREDCPGSATWGRRSYPDWMDTTDFRNDDGLGSTPWR
jgi:hypothetical protein